MAASLLCDCDKALALVHAFIRGFLGRAQLVLVVTVDRGHGWEHIMDAICVLLVGPSWAVVTYTDLAHAGLGGTTLAGGAGIIS